MQQTHVAHLYGRYILIYSRPFALHWDCMKAPNGWRVPNFQKFSGEDSTTTLLHIIFYILQLQIRGVGENDYMNVRNFPLSLTGTILHGLHLCLNVLLAHGPNYKIRILKYFGRIEATKPRTTKLSAISKIDSDPSKSSVAKTEQHSDPFE